MQTTIKILDDIAKLGASLFGLALGVKDEIKARVKSKGEHMVKDMNLVARDEFEVVRTMAQRSRQDFAELDKRVTNLEAKPTKTKKKP